MLTRELYIDDQLADLSDTSPVALTLQVNNLAELKDRQSLYSNSVKLPKTSTNRKIFGFADENPFTQNQPYQTQQLKLVQNGIEVITAGQVVLKTVSNFFEVQLSYGLKGLNDALKKNVYDTNGFLSSIDDAKLVDLNWADIPNFTFDLATIVASQSGTGVLWPVIDYGSNSSTFTLNQSSVISTHNFRPAVSFRQIFDRMQRYTGYTFFGGTAYSDGLDDYIPLCDTDLKDYQGTKYYDTFLQLSVVKNLPDFTLKDLLKDYMQRYFLTPVVDNYKKTVVFRSFDELYANIPYAKNWTDKFVQAEQNTSFTLGSYAQANKLLWTPDEPFFNVEDGSIIINNSNLQLTTTLVTSIFAASITSFNVLAGNNVARINKLSEKPDLTESKPRVLRVVNAKAGNYTFRDDNGNTLNGPAKIGQFIGWPKLVPLYGMGLLKMLQKVRLDVKEAVLSDLDVKDFDFFTPVYDARESANYYVNQIPHYQSGKTCKVNLIRL